MHRFIFSTFLCSFFSYGLLAQSYVQRAIEDWNELIRNDLEGLKQSALETILTGITEENTYAMMVGKRSLGSYFCRTGMPEKSFPILEDAALYFTKRGDYTLAAETYNELGNARMLNGCPEDAQRAYLTSLKFGKRSVDPTATFLAEVNYAQSCLQLGDTIKAEALLHHYKRMAYQFKKWEAVSNAYAILGKIAQQRDQIDLTVELFQKSASFAKRSKVRSMTSQALTNLAIVHFSREENSKAEKLFFQAYYIRRKLGASRELAESMYNLAAYYHENGMDDQAISWYERTMSYAEKELLVNELKDANAGLIDLYESNGSLEKAYRQMKEFAMILEKLLKEKQSEREWVQNIMHEVDLYELDIATKNKSNNSESERVGVIAWFVSIGFLAPALTWFILKRQRLRLVSSGGKEK